MIAAETRPLPDVALVPKHDMPPGLVAVLRGWGWSAVCLYNRRLLRGGEVFWVEQWATRSTAGGWRFAVLPRAALDRLRAAQSVRP